MIYKRACIVLSLWTMLMADVYGQIEFEKGYVINLDGQRIECLIKNHDWKNNPDQIVYKTGPSEENVVGTVATVKEFQVYGYSKYVVTEVNIDRSPDEYSSLTSTREPSWSAEKLFLKVLIDGKASLYMYESTNFSRFFYAVDAAPVRQLVHKEYKVELQVGENNMFQQQLLNEVNCGGLTASQLKLVRYTSSELTKYFKKYNACHGSEPVKHTEDGTATKERVRVKRDVFVLKISPGMNYTQLTVTHLNNEKSEYEKAFSPRLGIESEFIFPFNKNKLSFLFEPSLQSYKADKTSGSGSVDFTTIEFPFGLRYYFYLNQKSRVFLNLHYVPMTPFTFNSSLKIRSDFELDVKPGDNVAVGAGFALGRFSGEIRYYSSKEVAVKYVAWESSLKTVAFIFGYQLAKIRSKG